MRVNFVELDLTEGHQDYRYRDILEHPRALQERLGWI
jgi:hypothetical protein